MSINLLTVRSFLKLEMIEFSEKQRFNVDELKYEFKNEEDENRIKCKILF